MQRRWVQRRCGDAGNPGRRVESLETEFGAQFPLAQAKTQPEGEPSGCCYAPVGVW